jgi:hypothetical protein
LSLAFSYLFLSLCPFVSWLSQSEQFSSTVSFSYDELLYHRLKNREPSDHGLKPLKLWAKINPSSLRLFFSALFVIGIDNWLTQRSLFYFLFLWFWLHYILLMNGQHILFVLWLDYFVSIMILKFIHVATCDRIPFFKVIHHFIVYHVFVFILLWIDIWVNSTSWLLWT